MTFNWQHAATVTSAIVSVLVEAYAQTGGVHTLAGAFLFASVALGLYSKSISDSVNTPAAGAK